MKLMPSPQAKQAVDSQTQQDLIRASEAKLELRNALNELNQAESSFKLALVNQHIHQMNEETQNNEVKKALLDEIKVLEKRREQLLIPIEEEKQKAHNILTSAEEIKQKNLATEVALEQKAELLENKLDDVSEQLEIIVTRTVGLDQRELGIKKQAEMTKNFCDDMTSKIEARVAYCVEKEKEIGLKTKDLQFKEISLKSLEDIIKLEQEFINKEKVRLVDREQTLERNIKRNG